MRLTPFKQGRIDGLHRVAHLNSSTEVGKSKRFLGRRLRDYERGVFWGFVRGWARTFQKEDVQKQVVGS